MNDYTAYTIALLTPPGIQVQDQVTISAEHFAQVSSSSNGNVTFLSYKSITEKQKLPARGSMKEEYRSLFTIDELRNSLSTRKHIAPGDIHYAMLQCLSEDAANALLKFFNKVWVTGTVPQAWKRAVVIPFLKTGKSYTVPNSYHPVALTSCLKTI